MQLAGEPYSRHEVGRFDVDLLYLTGRGEGAG
jgi:hypothetical protein